MLASLTKAVATAVDEQDFTTATKLKLKAAIIGHHQEPAEHTSRALRGLSRVSAPEWVRCIGNHPIGLHGLLLTCGETHQPMHILACCSQHMLSSNLRRSP